MESGTRIWLPRGSVIPWYLEGDLWQVKFCRPKTDPRYVAVRGGRPVLVGADTLTGHGLVALVEGELDAILLEQECGDLVGVATRGGASRKPDVLAVEHLLGARVIFALHDADAAGEAGAGHLAMLTSRAQRLRVPSGKDLPAFVREGGHLRAWIQFDLERLGLLAEETTAPSVMTLDEVFASLRERDAWLHIEHGQLVVGPTPLATGDPLQDGIAAYHDVLIEMFTYARQGRCVFDGCYRLLAEDDKIVCPDHRRQLDAAPKPWEQPGQEGIPVVCAEE